MAMENDGNLQYRINMETERRRCIGGEGQMTQAKLGSHLEDWVDGNDIN